MTPEQAAKAYQEIGAKVAAKLREVRQSEAALLEIENRYQLAPMGREIERIYRVHTAQLGRRLRKLHKLQLQQLAAQQVLELVHREAQADQRRHVEADTTGVREKVQMLALALAREGALDFGLSVGPGRKGDVLYTHGKQAHADLIALDEALVLHARQTARGHLTELAGALGILSQPDVRELVRWAHLAAGGTVEDLEVPAPEEVPDDDDQEADAMVPDTEEVPEHA